MIVRSRLYFVKWHYTNKTELNLIELKAELLEVWMRAASPEVRLDKITDLMTVYMTTKFKKLHN